MILIMLDSLVIRYIPKNFKYASTINFWNSIILLILKKKVEFPNYLSICEPISLSILVTGSKQIIKRDNRLSSFFGLENVIQHIIPFILNGSIYRTQKSNLTLLNKITYILVISGIYCIYVIESTDRHPTNIYPDFNNDTMLTISISIMYLILKSFK